MAADSLIPSMYVRHTGHELPEIIRASFQILEQLPRMADRVADFRPFNLADAVAQDFAQKALALRYSDPALAPIRAEQLLDIRRGEDAGNSLWAVTNRARICSGAECGTRAA
jgi:hypothetical protein